MFGFIHLLTVQIFFFPLCCRLRIISYFCSFFYSDIRTNCSNITGWQTLLFPPPHIWCSWNRFLNRWKVQPLTWCAGLTLLLLSPPSLRRLWSVRVLLVLGQLVAVEKLELHLLRLRLRLRLRHDQRLLRAEVTHRSSGSLLWSEHGSVLEAEQPVMLLLLLEEPHCEITWLHRHREEESAPPPLHPLSRRVKNYI